MQDDEMQDMHECMCHHWATNNIAMMVLTGHHEACMHRPRPEEKALALIAQLVAGIEEWAADGDGIHDAVWDAVEQARTILRYYSVHK